MIYVLILMYWSSAGPMTTAEFGSKEACLSAKEVVSKELSRSIYGVCVPKGNAE